MSFMPTFTHAELLAAFSLVMPEDEARVFADPAAEATEGLGSPGGAIGISYGDATLDLLAMVSPETAAKVEAYRRGRRGE
jgi:hypothetical protein